jgi:hypothetical protein
MENFDKPWENYLAKSDSAPWELVCEIYMEISKIEHFESA